MLWMLVSTLVLLWLVANLAALTLGGFTHLLLVLAAGLAAFRLWKTRTARRGS